jgi:hypothetical protein
MKDTGSRPAPGASGEFGSHAIRLRSGHHMQVMTVVVEATVKFPPSSRRKPGSSVFRYIPEKIQSRALKSLSLKIKLRPQCLA